MRMLLDHLDKLYAFAVIAEVGSLQGAARRLNSSQPALSLKIRALEEALSQQFFIRSKSGMQLTAPGRSLYRFSKRLIQDTQNLSFDEPADHAQMRIGTFDVIARMISRGVCQIPGVTDLHFRVERTGLALLDALEKGEIDLAIVDDPPHIPGFSYRPLACSPFGLFAAPAFVAKLPKGAARLAAIRSAPLVFIHGGLAYDVAAHGKRAPKMLIDSFVDQLELGQVKRIRVDSFVLGMEIALQGDAIGLLLAGHILAELGSGALVELSHASLSLPFSSMLHIVTKDGDPNRTDRAVTTIEGVFQAAVALYARDRPQR